MGEAQSPLRRARVPAEAGGRGLRLAAPATAVELGGVALALMIAGPPTVVQDGRLPPKVP